MFQTRRRKIERLDFIVAGAQKSGTTALHYFLAKHPNITMGDQQEIHFFDDDATFAATADYERLHKHYPLVAHRDVWMFCQEIVQRRRSRFLRACHNEIESLDFSPSGLKHRHVL